MPTETAKKGEISVYLVVDEEEKEIKPLPVWFSYKLLKKQKRDLDELMESGINLRIGVNNERV